MRESVLKRYISAKCHVMCLCMAVAYLMYKVRNKRVYQQITSIGKSRYKIAIRTVLQSQTCYILNSTSIWCFWHHSISALMKSEFAQPVGTSLFADMVIRYINMNYLFFSSMLHAYFIRLVMSYDIICQCYVHLWEWMLDFPD